MKKSKNVTFAYGVLLLCLSVSYLDTVHSQPLPAIPEPGLILYGQVRNVSAGNRMLTYGTLQWTVQPLDGSPPITVSVNLTNINDQFSYVARVPFQTVLPGFVLSANHLPLQPFSPGYTRAATVIVPGSFNPGFILPPASPSFAFSALDRGRIERVDLQVSVLMTDVSDRDGLDDHWERAYFGTLSHGASDDPDGDGMSNGDEQTAGTNPTDAQSRFAFIRMEPEPAGGMRVTWSSVAGMKYRLERSAELTAGFGVIQSNIAATDNTTTFVDGTAAESGPHFYRLRVE